VTGRWKEPHLLLKKKTKKEGNEDRKEDVACKRDGEDLLCYSGETLPLYGKRNFNYLHETHIGNQSAKAECQKATVTRGAARASP